VAHRESPRLDRRCACDANGRLRAREAGLWMLHAQSGPVVAPTDGWRRQRVRPPRLRGLARELGFTPHVAQIVTRTGGSAIDGRTRDPAAMRRVNMPARASSQRSGG
jgi:hypothetical protein